MGAAADPTDELNSKAETITGIERNQRGYERVKNLLELNVK